LKSRYQQKRIALILRAFPLLVSPLTVLEIPARQQNMNKLTDAFLRSLKATGKVQKAPEKIVGIFVGISKICLKI